jgi:Mg-chelatase subunit ChlD
MRSSVALVARNAGLVASLFLLARCTTDDNARVAGRAANAGSGAVRAVVKPPAMPVDAGTPDAGEPHLTAALPAPNVASIFQGGCATSSMESQLLPSNLLFVIDRSSSMACNPPPTTASTVCEAKPARVDPQQPTKWQITRSALSSAINQLPRETVVGLTYFSNDDACGVHPNPSVPLAKLDDAQRSVVAASLANVEPGGATPLVGATILAYQHLHKLALAGEIHGKQFVVLLTDGQQSDACSDPDRCNGQVDCTNLLYKEVPLAAGPGVGIKTFVIGAPGSDSAGRVLSQIAKSGGTASSNCDVDAGNCHFNLSVNPDFDQALADALTEIAGRALSCELQMPRPDAGQADPRFLNVVYSPADGSPPRLILKDDRVPCDRGADGWQLSEDTTKIEICGPTCDKVRADRGARVDVVLGCPVQGPQ